MTRNAIEAVMGAVVLIIAIFFLGFGYIATKNASMGGVRYFADYQTAGGLRAGADVKSAGISIGMVETVSLNPQSFKAEIALVIDPAYQVPNDSSARILNDGLMGGQYIDIVFGNSQTSLNANDRFSKTEDAVSLEDMLGRAIFTISQTP